MAAANPLVFLTFVLCASFFAAYILWGATRAGDNFFLELTSLVIRDENGGLPLVTLAGPILVSATVAATFLTASPPHPLSGGKGGLVSRTLRSRWPEWIQAFFEWVFRIQVLKIWTWFTFVIAVPLFIYAFCNMRRHGVVDEIKNDANVLWLHRANALSLCALMAVNIQLILATRHSVLIQLLRLPYNFTMRLHQWTGRLILAFLLCHGSIHMYRWGTINGEDVPRMFTVPYQCWTSFESFNPKCNNIETECSCYDRLRNAVGLSALILLCLIALLSVGPLRRRSYTFFFRFHAIATTIFVALVVLHWFRSILWISGGLLYYLACTIPTRVDTYSTCSSGEEPVTLVSVERVGDEFVSLTIQASPDAMTSFRPGLFVRLRCPEVSPLSHPFSINRIFMNDEDEGGTDSTAAPAIKQLRVIFKVTGRFTNRLRTRLFDASKTPPSIHIDGYFGIGDRFSKIWNHDEVLIVAGGIGITPYLSLLHAIQQGYGRISAAGGIIVTRKVHVHWICYDEALIDYVSYHYFAQFSDAPVVNSIGQTVMSGTIYHTAAAQTNAAVELATLALSNQNNFRRFHVIQGESWNPSPFAPANWPSIVQNRWSLAALVLIGWLGLVWVWTCYQNINQVDRLFPRIFSLFVLMGWSVAVSHLFHMCSHRTRVDCDDAGVYELPQTDDAHGSPFFQGAADSLPGREHSEEFMPHILKNKVDVDPLASSTRSSGDNFVGSTSRVFSVKHAEGRPVWLELLKSVDDAFNPAVFACGPDSLMYDLRMAIRSRNVSRGFCRLDDQDITLYEESFAL